MKPPNRVKAAMRASRKAYGYNLSFPSPWVIDILGKLDFDFVFIDGEHGPFGLDQLEDLCSVPPRYDDRIRRPASSSISLTHAPCITSDCIVRPTCRMRRVISSIVLTTSGWSGWPG